MLKPVIGLKNLYLCLFMLLMLATIVCPTTAQILVLEQGQTFRVALLRYESNSYPDRILNDQIMKCCRGEAGYASYCTEPDPDDVQGCWVSESQRRLRVGEYTAEFGSVQNANFTFTYFSPSLNRNVPLPGCSPVITADHPFTSEGVEGRELQVWYATCTMPDDVYDIARNDGGVLTRRLNIIITAPSNLNDGLEARYTTQISDPRSGEVSVSVVNRLKETMRAFVSSGGPAELRGEVGSLPCLGVFLILGLLFASMYFAGKSPISLLDIASPRLPAPKGIVAGGQILAPFGYTEMKRVLKDSMGKGAGAVGVGVSALVGSMSRRAGAGIHGSLGSASGAGFSGRGRSSRSMNINEVDELCKLSGNASATLADKIAGDVKGQRAMAANMAILARFAGMSMDEARLLARKMPYHYTDAEHRIVGRLVENLERMDHGDGKYALQGAAIRNYMVGLRTWMTLEVLTAHPDVGKRSVAHQMVQTVLGKMFMPSRFAILGPVILSSVDSTVRTARVGGRGVIATVKHTAGLARDVGRTVTTTLVGGERAFHSRAAAAKRRGGASGWAYGQMTKHSKDIEVGTLFPVKQKMEYFYKALREEITQDQIRYTLKQIYKELGLNFDISESQLVGMIHKDMDVLSLSGYRSLTAAQKSRLQDVEEEINRILTNRSHTSRDMLAELTTLGGYMGASIDPHGIMTMLNHRLDAIAASATPEYLKLIRLQETLEEHHAHNPAAGVGQTRIDDHYYSLVGRDHIHGGDLWQMMVLRTMAWDAQNDHFVHAGIKEELQSAWLKVVNRGVSLRPTTGVEQLPEFMRNMQEMKKIETRVRNTLFELIEDRGMFEDYLKKRNKSYSAATIDDFVEYMKGGGRVPRSREDLGRFGARGRTAWWEEDFELPPLRDAFKVDMKSHWLTQLDERENLALAQWVQSRFTRGYTAPFNPSIEARLDRLGVTDFKTRNEMVKRMWVQDYVERDLLQRFNSQFTNNAYGSTHDTTKFYTGTLAAFTEKMLREIRMLPENDPAFERVRNLDVRNPDHLRGLRHILSDPDNVHGMDKVLSGRVNYDDISKGSTPWVILREGGLVPYRQGMSLSNGDRVLGGEVAIRDNKGHWRPYVPDDVTVTFKDIHLENEWKRLVESQKPSHIPRDWRTFIADVIHWSKEDGYDYERQKILGAVLWRYGQMTYDYDNYWRHTGVKVMPKREVTPLAPNLFRMFGWEAPGLMKAFKPIRDIGLHIGDYVSKVALDSGGALHRASWDITPYSEYYKQLSWRLSQRIFSGDFDALDLTKPEKEAYVAYAVAHGAYHQVWDYCIDRNPWVRSTSFGSHQAWDTFFHFGPSRPYGMKDNLRAYMSRGEWWNFMAHSGFAIDLARDVMMPYVNMTRGIQMSMQGYASKWESSMNPLRQYNYTTPRIAESFQAVNPFSFSLSKDKIAKWDFLRNGVQWASAGIHKLNLFESSLEKRQLAGQAFMKGLSVGPQDVWVQEQGVYSVARTGSANPGSSFYDYRATLQLDPRMAETFMRMGDTWTIFDKYIQESAMNTIQRRTVSAESLSIIRSQELRGFGISQNSMFGFLNVPLYFWHSPLPGLHFAGLRNITSMAFAAYKNRARGGSWMDKVAAAGANAGGTALRALTPWNLASQTHCACGRIKPRGSTCQCGAFLYK